MQFGAMNYPIRPVLEEIEVIGTLGFDYRELAMDAPEPIMNGCWRSIDPSGF